MTPSYARLAFPRSEPMQPTRHRLERGLVSVVIFTLIAIPGTSDAESDGSQVRSVASEDSSGSATGTDGSEADDVPAALPDKIVEAAQLGPEEILDHYGLQTPESCLTFEDERELARRTKRWTRALETLDEHHPDFVYDWLTGRSRPPERALQTTLEQRTCLIDALLEDAREDDELLIEIEFKEDTGEDDTITDRDRLEGLAEKYAASSYYRSEIRDALTKSHYRSAFGQAGIWLRKFRFEGDAFNHITERAAERCGLHAGGTWDPDNSAHARCWHGELDGPEREREILAASSAPGLSRHHWGTEVDLFDLNPYRFLDGKRRSDEYDWMREHASRYGFYQPYRGEDAAYVEERWHWSYLPIGVALTRFADRHRGELGSRLDALWDHLQDRIADADDGQLFDYVRRKWPSYVFGVHPPPIP